MKKINLTEENKQKLIESIKTKLKEEKEAIQRVLNPADADAFAQHEEALKQNAERRDPANYEKEVKELIKDTASEESRYRHFDVVDRKDLAKKINEAKQKGQKFKVSRSDKAGYRYSLDVLNESLKETLYNLDGTEVPGSSEAYELTDGTTYLIRMFDEDEIENYENTFDNLDKAIDKATQLLKDSNGKIKYCDIISLPFVTNVIHPEDITESLKELPDKIEDLPLKAREEVKEADDKVERICEIIGHIENLLDFHTEEEKKADAIERAKKIISDLIVGFNIDKDEVKERLGNITNNKEANYDLLGESVKLEEKKTLSQRMFDELGIEPDKDDTQTTEKVDEELKVYTSSLDGFQPSVKAADFWNEIVEAGKVEDLEYSLDNLYPAGLSDVALDHFLYEEEDWIRDLIDLPYTEKDAEIKDVEAENKEIVDDGIEDVEEYSDDFDTYYDDYEDVDAVEDEAEPEYEFEDEPEDYFVDEEEIEGVFDDEADEEVFTKREKKEDVEESLKEGKRQIYQDLEDDYFKALSKAEKDGAVYFFVDEEEFNTFEEAKKYAKKNGKDKIIISSFGIEGPNGYDNGDYEDYDEVTVDLDKNIIDESLKEDIEENNIAYIVHSDIDENNIYAEFDSEKEAIEYAKENGIKENQIYIDKVEIYEDGEEKVENILSYTDDDIDESLDDIKNIKMDGVDVNIDKVEVETKDTDYYDDFDIEPIEIEDEKIDEALNTPLDNKVADKLEAEGKSEEEAEEIIDGMSEADKKGKLQESVEIEDGPDAVNDEMVEAIADGFVNKNFKEQGDPTEEKDVVKEAVKEAITEEDEVVVVDDDMINEMLGAPKESK